jgi:hypothetical protein
VAAGAENENLWVGSTRVCRYIDLSSSKPFNLELWNWDGTLERIHHALYVAVRKQQGREASPTVAIIDLQTAKGAQKGGLGSILQATTRARRSKVASGTSWSTRWVYY